MTIAQMQTLGDVIREALDVLPGAAVRDVVNWIRENRRSVVEENFETISYQGLSAMVRAARKLRLPIDGNPDSENLCLDFGLPPLPLEREISVPRDMENLINSPCDWPELEEATIRELDKHIELLRAQGDATLRQAEHCKRLRQAAMRFSPDENNLDITIGELRKIAREQKR